MSMPTEFISAVINAFEANKRLADRAVEQVPDDKLHVALDTNTNSIAVIMKHVAGNLLSRWTDFLRGGSETTSSWTRSTVVPNYWNAGSGAGAFAGLAQRPEAR